MKLQVRDGQLRKLILFAESVQKHKSVKMTPCGFTGARLFLAQASRVPQPSVFVQSEANQLLDVYTYS